MFRFELSTRKLCWHSNICDPREGVSKAEAIKKLAQKLGILIKDIIAFGDEVNDIEMLTLVGLGIAMENADDVVKEAADQIAGRNDQDGVGKELEKIFGNAGK